MRDVATRTAPQEHTVVPPGERLAQLRKGRKLSLRGTSGRLGISTSSLLRIERGERRPGIEEAFRIRDVFGLAVEIWVPGAHW